MESVRKKANTVVRLVQDGNLGLEESLELVRNCKMDNEGQLYDPNTGEIFKDVDALEGEELKEFLKYV